LGCKSSAGQSIFGAKMNLVYLNMFERMGMFIFPALFALSCHAENFVQYQKTESNTYYVDTDELRLVVKGRTLVYGTSKDVFSKKTPYGAAYRIDKFLIDCNQQYSTDIFWGLYTFDNVPLETREEQQLNDAIDAAFAWYEHPDHVFNGISENDQLLCSRVVARWVYENSKGSNVRTIIESAKSNSVASVPLTKSGGVYLVKATINSELKLTFIVDSGAADVTLPESIGKALFANGSITKSDILGVQEYVLANGVSHSGTVVNLKSLTIGDVTINNVRASIFPGDDTSLLLGQSALKKLGVWRINTKINRLEIDKN
jgi:aspartyl protease family protein